MLETIRSVRLNRVRFSVPFFFCGSLYNYVTLSIPENVAL